ncbi:MAG: hypothetical protein GF401_11665 [Chitinivibrionales bacterium]|nr:hypothetical protein [Chitinivibrionales bacterium]
MLEPNTEQWERIPLAGSGHGRSPFRWNEEGLRVKTFGTTKTSLSGKIGRIKYPLRFGYQYDTLGMQIDSSSGDTTFILDSLGREAALFVPASVDIPADLTLHTELRGNRYMDLFFDNSRRNRKTRRGLSYRGNRTDNIETVEAGTGDTRRLSSELIPLTRYEGGGMAVQSRKRLADRDLPVITGAAGGGFAVSRVSWTTMEYSSSGIYLLKEDTDTVMIVPGSVRIWVDGEELDKGAFQFIAETGTISMQRTARDIIDPASVILISYETETIPDGDIEQPELIPRNHFGTTAYAVGEVAPSEWVRLRSSYLARDDTALTHTVNFGAPIEYRLKKNKSVFKFHPEGAWNSLNGAGAGHVSSRNRIGGRLGLSFDAFLVDTAYESTRPMEKGFGLLENAVNAAAAFDFTPDITAGYSVNSINSSGGTRHRHALTGHIHVPGLPFFDVTAARYTIDARDKTDSLASSGFSDTTADSMKNIDMLKDKVRLTVYEAQSDFVSRFLRIQKFKYSLSYNHFQGANRLTREKSAGHGVSGYGTATITNSVALTGEGAYRIYPGTSLLSREWTPSLQLSTFNAPPGCDLNGRYTLEFRRFRNSADTLRIEREIIAILKPGAWFPPLGRLSPRTGIRESARLIPAPQDNVADDMVMLTHADYRTLSPFFGFYLFPFDGFTITNMNTWTFSDTADFFSTENEVQWSMGPAGLMKTVWDYFLINNDTEQHEGFIRYDRSWLPWLRTNMDVKGMYTTKDSGSTGNVGPRIKMYVRKRDLFLLKAVNTEMSYAPLWHYGGGSFEPHADHSIAYYLRLHIVPNIHFDTRHTINWIKGSFGDYESVFRMSIYF